MFLISDKTAIPKQDDKTIMGEFAGSPTFLCLAEEKAIDAVMVCAKKMAESFRFAGFEIVKWVGRLGDIGPRLVQVIHRQEV